MKESSAWIKTHSLGVSISTDNPNVGTRKSESPIWSGGAQSDKLKVKLRQGVGTKALSSCKHLFVTDSTLLARESGNGALAPLR